MKEKDVGTGRRGSLTQVVVMQILGSTEVFSRYFLLVKNFPFPL